MRRVFLELVAGAVVVFAAHLTTAQSQQYQPQPCVQTAASCVALNPDVTPETIAQTICVPGYTATVRPGSSYVTGIKEKIGRDAGLPSEVAGAMILDHIIPLALGGHPRQPSNLQLQELGESRRKDHIEIKLQCLVCSGQVPLDEARAAIAIDWQAAYHQFARVKCHRPGKMPNTERRETSSAD
jgi:cytochrome c-type biogenesis protein CcmH/NrfF